MSLKRLEPEDFLISTEAIIAPAFGNSPVPGTSEISTVGNVTFKGGSDGKVDYAEVNLTGDAGGVIKKGLENIIGDTISGTKAFVIERSRFKQSIYPYSFKPDQGDAYTFTDAGRKFGNLYPDIGLYIGGSAPTHVDSEEVITSNYIFIRARNAEFNYSTNPSFIDSGSGGVLYTDFITAPQTFITTVGLYNDNGDLLAVAKLSKPLKKDFTKEALIRVKLDF